MYDSETELSISTIQYVSYAMQRIIQCVIDVSAKFHHSIPYDSYQKILYRKINTTLLSRIAFSTDTIVSAKSPHIHFFNPINLYSPVGSSQAYVSVRLSVYPVIRVDFWQTFARPVIARIACGCRPRGRRNSRFKIYKSYMFISSGVQSILRVYLARSASGRNI